MLETNVEQGTSTMKIAKCLKRSNEARNRRYHQLVERVARTNDTRFLDGIVLAVLKADRGQWSKAMTVEELFAVLGIDS